MTLHLATAFRAPLDGETSYQPFELQQVRNAEQRASLTQDYLGIGRYAVSPLWRNRADRRLVDPQEEPLAVPVVSHSHAEQPVFAERVEWVGHADKVYRSTANSCIVR